MNRQRGFMLPLVLGLLLVGTLLWQIDGERLLQRLNSAHAERSRAALAEAREALISHALTYAITHPTNPRPGLLPCPDSGNDGSAQTCGSAGNHAVGWLPFRTLALPRLLDGSGNCLWYAVAGRFKNNPDTALAHNWDSPGQFHLLGPRGAPLTDPADARRHAVAVVFAPGRPLDGQSRGTGEHACPGGGNAASELAAHLESALAPPSGASFEVQQGEWNGEGNNDAVAWITAQEIFERLQRTAYFEAFLNQFLAALAADLDPLPEPEDPAASPDGSLQLGRAPGGLGLGIADPARRAVHEDWRPMVRYLRCTPDPASGVAPACLTVNGLPCRGLIAFGGARSAGQTRSTDDLAEYFEAPLLAALAGFEASYAGAGAVDLAQPAQDVLGCIA